MKKNEYKIIAAIALFGIYLTYQNCTPSKGGAFNIGSNNTGPVISSFNLSQTAYAMNSPMSASANVATQDSNLICAWNFLLNGASISSVNTPLDLDTCALPNGTVAPATLGSYVLTLTVTDSANISVSASVNFTVATNVSPTPSPSPSGSPSSNTIKYSCPLAPSNSCDATGLCQTTCDGQYSNSPTCTSYGFQASPMTSNCTAISTITTIYTCPFIHSSGCDSSSSCNSTCVGQYQAGATCSVKSANGVPTTVNCTTIKGVPSENLYSCPVIHSMNCSSSSSCESGCVGQVGKNPTCNYYEQNGVAVTANCSFLGTYTF